MNGDPKDPKWKFWETDDDGATRPNQIPLPPVPMKGRSQKPDRRNSGSVHNGSFDGEDAVHKAAREDRNLLDQATGGGHSATHSDSDGPSYNGWLDD